MAAKNGAEIREIKDVVREHVLATMSAHPGLPKWKLASGLGVHPNTLARLLGKWAGDGEELVRDRR